MGEAMSPYACKTIVPVERTKGELDSMLSQKYGASAFIYGANQFKAFVEFEMSGRRIRFEMPLPQENQFLYDKEYNQALRTKWRCLLLTIKGKLESVANEIEMFEEAFLGQIVLPSKQTFGQWAVPQIRNIYERGDMPKLLEGGQS